MISAFIWQKIDLAELQNSNKNMEEWGWGGCKAKLFSPWGVWAENGIQGHPEGQGHVKVIG